MAPRKGFLIAGAGALALLLFRRKDVVLALDATKEAAFKLALPSHAKPYGDIILTAAKRTGVSPFIIYAIGDQESRWGDALTPKGPGGTGDFTARSWGSSPTPPDGLGWGRGIMQIDFNAHKDWIQKNNWRDPLTNVMKGLEVYTAARSYFSSKPKTPYVTLTGNEATRRGVPEGKTYPDVRPLSGNALIEASLAAYNTGSMNVLRNLAAGKSPDFTTTHGNYSKSLLARAAVIMSKLT